MRLVIEREGGFDIIEDSDAITKIDVMNFGVKVTFMAADGGEWSEVYPVADHAAACRLSAAIAVRCGTLVEELAEQPTDSQWVAGEPPKDGRWYVCAELGNVLCVYWAEGQHRVSAALPVEFGPSVRHLPTPVAGVPVR
jgi:hypothetical protein